ncbi:response regulator transcription factor [Mumia sp. Pv 4-285]|uniref:response regulator transcription factor n=1 Tax=Mumia qirimensis TaxID=3234852 RepID=UPI00351D2680
MSTPIRVLLVDDEPLVRRGLRAILESDAGIEVVGEAADGAAALASARSLTPDVVCMDVRMPGVDGIRATELVLALEPAPRVLVVTTFESDEYVFDALRVGASGFLLKRADADQVVAAVRAVAAGESLLFPESVRRMAVRHAPAQTTYRGPALTPRETEVLTLVSRGMSNPEIATELVLGVETVRTHVANVLSKLGARDRTQAVVVAYETGLVSTAR